MQNDVENALLRTKHGGHGKEVWALEDFRIEQLTRVMKEVYDIGCIPNNLFKSVFIALPKRAGIIEFQNQPYESCSETSCSSYDFENSKEKSRKLHLNNVVL